MRRSRERLPLGRAAFVAFARSATTGERPPWATRRGPDAPTAGPLPEPRCRWAGRGLPWAYCEPASSAPPRESAPRHHTPSLGILRALRGLEFNYTYAYSDAYIRFPSAPDWADPSAPLQAPCLLNGSASPTSQERSGRQWTRVLAAGHRRCPTHRRPGGLRTQSEVRELRGEAARRDTDRIERPELRTRRAAEGVAWSTRWFQTRSTRLRRHSVTPVSEQAFQRGQDPATLWPEPPVAAPSRGGSPATAPRSLAQSPSGAGLAV